MFNCWCNFFPSIAYVIYQILLFITICVFVSLLLSTQTTMKRGNDRIPNTADFVRHNVRFFSLNFFACISVLTLTPHIVYTYYGDPYFGFICISVGFDGPNVFVEMCCLCRNRIFTSCIKLLFCL